jgi:LmbE family N-acetylglucosaminyl deacetylase
MFLADGVSSRFGVNLKDDLRHRRDAARRAAEILGVEDVTFGDLPDNRMDTVALLDLVRMVEERVEAVRPTIVYTHSPIDLNIDHRLTHESVVTACRPQMGQSVRTILSFEVPSSTHWRSPSSSGAFTPNWFVDVSDVAATKMRALEAYAEELRPWPHPRSIEAVEALARWYGASIGVSAAEAFCVERHLR